MELPTLLNPKCNPEEGRSITVACDRAYAQSKIISLVFKILLNEEMTVYSVNPDSCESDIVEHVFESAPNYGDEVKWSIEAETDDSYSIASGVNSCNIAAKVDCVIFIGLAAGATAITKTYDITVSDEPIISGDNNRKKTSDIVVMEKIN